MSARSNVREFHETFEQPLGDIVQTRKQFAEGQWDAVRLAMRLALVEEEALELREAVEAGDLVEIVDALADIVYVAYGFATELGVDLDDIIDEVHRSNMTKLGPNGQIIRRDDGKILKPDTFKAPDIAKRLQLQALGAFAALEAELADEKPNRRNEIQGRLF